MISSTVWNNLVTTLKNNPTLSGYIKYVYEGQRFDIEPESLPCLMLEPIQDGDVEKEWNNYQKVFLTVNVYAFSSNNFNEFNRTIVGGQDYKGILDINNDLRACLISSNTLGGNVIDIQIQSSLFDQVNTEKYPVRGMVMPIKILYQQQEGV